MSWVCTVQADLSVVLSQVTVTAEQRTGWRTWWPPLQWLQDERMGPAAAPLRPRVHRGHALVPGVGRCVCA